MGRFIVHHKGWFFEWSTVVDAPVTYGMTRLQYEAYYLEENGTRSASELAERMKRTLEKGTSAHDYSSAEELMEGYNRAGFRETYLTPDEIIRIYCVEQRSPRDGEGVKLPDEDDEEES